MLLLNYLIDNVDFFEELNLFLLEQNINLLGYIKCY